MKSDNILVIKEKIPKIVRALLVKWGKEYQKNNTSHIKYYKKKKKIKENIYKKE